MNEFQKHTNESLQKQFKDTANIISNVLKDLKGLESTNKQVLSFYRTNEKFREDPTKILKQRGIFAKYNLVIY